MLLAVAAQPHKTYLLLEETRPFQVGDEMGFILSFMNPAKGS